ncbi:hypothetical protein PENSPDRAFT_92757 [Peniophora sp. CONT]|nr:hypothetical protein PENSPDRAFT_92757 [Peniophora sp. CONT]
MCEVSAASGAEMSAHCVGRVLFGNEDAAEHAPFHAGEIRVRSSIVTSVSDSRHANTGKGRPVKVWHWQRRSGQVMVEKNGICLCTCDKTLHPRSEEKLRPIIAASTSQDELLLQPVSILLLTCRRRQCLALDAYFGAVGSIEPTPLIVPQPHSLRVLWTRRHVQKITPT